MDSHCLLALFQSHVNNERFLRMPLAARRNTVLLVLLPSKEAQLRLIYMNLFSGWMLRHESQLCYYHDSSFGQNL